ncbi:MAG: DNA mismatch endonuclease Vsr [Verrucomicrobiota bacterium]|nr:DNA mismatch endonuclease Vsr [Verrucomicrobiota bacterium]
MDTLTKQQRSKLMAKIRSSGNKSTELRFVELLRKWRLSGWRRNQRLAGQPDFAFRQSKVAIFIDGCFWHGCKRHCRLPAANHSYWVKKIARNKSRDKAVSCALRQLGWRTLRIWQHELTRKNEARLLRRINKTLNSA